MREKFYFIPKLQRIVLFIPKDSFIEGKSFIIVPVNINDNLERGGTCNER
ncbi:hypothetical protein ROSEINA2194_04036 [Roseburia inulinivorans DSM 16841]|uniref:Uncharacterized protein n=1 Tax=Roseburia inulinivorans DSM 16841 TaxID=622312 RepID=C0FZ46_9FIRM|nr:hypothetical protein ROSEINA2194_04036 [Roseburia inulinivorans DSM 16841]